MGLLIDKEKVKKGLECCKACTNDDPFQRCSECPYNDISISVQDCRAVLSADALELLKEHEPKPIVNKWHKNPLGDYSRLHCPWCDRELDMQSAKEYVACPYCGRPVKWNENP